jgi:hypothetical protein
MHVRHIRGKHEEVDHRSRSHIGCGSGAGALAVHEMGYDPGTARKGEGDASAQGDATRQVIGDYAAGSFKFAVSYWFDGSGLARVTMSQKDDAMCRELQRDLTAKYGEPVEYEGGSVQRRMWADKPSGNRVVLISTNLAFCELQYAPLVSQAGAGL